MIYIQNLSQFNSLKDYINNFITILYDYKNHILCLL